MKYLSERKFILSNSEVIIPAECDKILGLIELIIFNDDCDFERVAVSNFLEKHLEEIQEQFKRLDDDSIDFLRRVIKKCREDIALELRFLDMVSCQEILDLHSQLRAGNHLEARKNFVSYSGAAFEKLQEISNQEALKIKTGMIKFRGMNN